MIDQNDRDDDYEPRETSVSNLLKLWRKGQRALCAFWKIWRDEYLLRLRERTQSTLRTGRNNSLYTPRINDIVLMSYRASIEQFDVNILPPVDIDIQPLVDIDIQPLVDIDIQPLVDIDIQSPVDINSLPPVDFNSQPTVQITDAPSMEMFYEDISYDDCIEISPSSSYYESDVTDLTDESQAMTLEKDYSHKYTQFLTLTLTRKIRILNNTD
ncbi:hypothetical protein ACF0H5_016850 [Mactra antiquata]